MFYNLLYVLDKIFKLLNRYLAGTVPYLGNGFSLKDYVSSLM